MLAASSTPAQSESGIYSTLVGIGLPDQFARLVTAQSGHETNGWTSPIYLAYNNAFGYGVDGTGAITGYEQVEDSVQDVVGWLVRKQDAGQFPDFSTITTPDQYATLLKAAGYYGDTETNYAAGIQRWFNANLTAAAGIGVGAVLVVALVIYLVTRKK